jgi:hypothetical protein
VQATIARTRILWVTNNGAGIVRVLQPLLFWQYFEKGKKITGQMNLQIS